MVPYLKFYIRGLLPQDIAPERIMTKEEFYSYRNQFPMEMKQMQYDEHVRRVKEANDARIRKTSRHLSVEKYAVSSEESFEKLDTSTLPKFIRWM